MDVELLESMLTQVKERFGLCEKQIEKLDPGATEKVLLLAAGQTPAGERHFPRLIKPLTA